MIANVRRPAWIPWWRIATTVLLAIALANSVVAGRVIESVIIGVLLAPSVGFVVVWVVLWKKDRLVGR
jgi:hypothetical protein